MAIPKNQVRSRNTIDQHEHCDDADAKRVMIVDQNGNPIDSGNPLPTTTVLSSAKVPKIFEVDMPLADTEYEFEFPENTRMFVLKFIKNKRNIQYTYVATESGTKYSIIRPGNNLSIEDLLLGSGEVTIYFQSKQANNKALFDV